MSRLKQFKKWFKACGFKQVGDEECVSVSEETESEVEELMERRGEVDIHYVQDCICEHLLVACAFCKMGGGWWTHVSKAVCQYFRAVLIILSLVIIDVSSPQYYTKMAVWFFCVSPMVFWSDHRCIMGVSLIQLLDP